MTYTYLSRLESVSEFNELYDELVAGPGCTITEKELTTIYHLFDDIADGSTKFLKFVDEMETFSNPDSDLFSYIYTLQNFNNNFVGKDEPISLIEADQMLKTLKASPILTSMESSIKLLGIDDPKIELNAITYQDKVYLTFTINTELIENEDILFDTLSSFQLLEVFKIEKNNGKDTAPVTVLNLLKTWPQ